MVKNLLQVTALFAAASISSVVAADALNLPPRPVNNFTGKSLPERTAELSEKDKLDLKNLVAAAKESQSRQEEEAHQSAVNNHMKMGRMPAAKTERDMATDTVTGTISEADMADRLQNKIQGDFYYILVSSSLSDDELRNIFSQYKDRNDVAFVIRGVKNKEDMLKELMHWQQLVLDSGSSATVNLDPTIFKSYHVTSVPTIIHEKDGELVSRVTGLTNVEYLKNKKGNLGTAGPSKDIAEVDLLEIIKDKIEKLDFNKMKSDALNNYWKKQQFQIFPAVVKYKQKKVTPSVVIPQDIMSPDGQVVAKRGKINPLNVIPFRLKLIFFDARMDWQRKIARREYQNVETGIQPILITTNVYGDGWQTFQDATEKYGDKARLYLLQPGMAERFNVTSLPSVVTADSNEYTIDEYPEEVGQK